MVDLMILLFDGSRESLGDFSRLPRAVALAAVPAVVVVSKEHSGATRGFVRALTTETGDLAVLIHLVVLEDCEFDLLLLGVGLLLALLASSEERKHQVKSRLLLDVVIRKSAAILELLASENETLLIRRDTFLVLDLGL